MKHGEFAGVGECQCCGDRFSIPDDLIPAHQWQKAWGCVLEICPGSGNPPINKSRNVLELMLEEKLKELAERRSVLDKTKFGSDQYYCILPEIERLISVTEGIQRIIERYAKKD